MIPIDSAVGLCMFQLLEIAWQMRAFVGHCCVSRNYCAASHATPFGELSSLNAMRPSAYQLMFSSSIEWNGTQVRAFVGLTVVPPGEPPPPIGLGEGLQPDDWHADWQFCARARIV